MSALVQTVGPLHQRAQQLQADIQAIMTARCTPIYQLNSDTSPLQALLVFHDMLHIWARHNNHPLLCLSAAACAAAYPVTVAGCHMSLAYSLCLPISKQQVVCMPLLTPYNAAVRALPYRLLT